MPHIPVAHIGIDPQHARQIATSAEQDAALVESLRAIGQLQPILVRRDASLEQADAYCILAGRRRLTAARQLGWAQIDAIVIEATDAAALAIEGAENMVRAAMRPVDQWRVLDRLRFHHYSPEDAAAALGLPLRKAAQMTKLGSLHPDVLALIEQEADLPEPRALGIIAAATHAQQRQAIRAKDAKAWGGGMDWHAIAQHCKTGRIPRNRAVFALDSAEAQKITWDEDLFAEPDSNDAFTTADTKRFLALQRAALADRVAADKARRTRVEPADATGQIDLPDGLRRTSDHAPHTKLRKSDCRWRVLGLIEEGARLGQIVEWIALDVPAQKAAEKAEKAKAKAAPTTKAKPGSADQPPPEDDDPDDADDAAPASDAPAKPAWSKAGQAIIDARKTIALRTALARPGLNAGDMLAALTAAVLAARNMQITGDVHRHGDTARALLRRLVTPAGAFAATPDADVTAIAGDTLAALLTCGDPIASYSQQSGPAAEWIGNMADADSDLPRFDDAEFLATLSGDALRAAARDAGIKPTGTAKSLRERCVGNMPAYRPTKFHAPGPSAATPAEDDATTDANATELEHEDADD